MQRTPLHALHLQHGAKLAPFAGYEMPIQYPDGILAEHRHTRQLAGLFDVSHMGQITLSADPARAEEVARALESLIPSDLLALPRGRQKYGLLTNARGGIIDDLMIQRSPESGLESERGSDHFVLVVNAACKHGDFDHLRRHLGDAFPMELREDRALLALQGPAAAAVMADFGNDLAELKFMAVRELVIDGVPCAVSRSGYTGEDGVEISLAADRAEALARQLLSHPSVKFAGLGARDSLRLEAGLCLYGQDIDAETTPVEAGLNWAISPARRAGGERAGGFPGADIILPQMAQMPQTQNNITRRRVGLLPEGRAPVRRGAALLDAAHNPAGAVTSGGFSPSLGHPVSMGYVPPQHASPGAALHAQVRGKLLPVTVTELPFVATRFYR